MSRARSVSVFRATFGLAIIAGSLLPGCGGSTQEAPTSKPEDAPAAKEKDSMDYFRNQMKKPGRAKK
jgi:hypothetical protein